MIGNAFVQALEQNAMLESFYLYQMEDHPEIMSKVDCLLALNHSGYQLLSATGEHTTAQLLALHPRQILL